MFDPKYYAHFSSGTYKEFTEFLASLDLPKDAQVNVGGEKDIYIHVEADKSNIDISDSSYSEMDCYKGISPIIEFVGSATDDETKECPRLFDRILDEYENTKDEGHVGGDSDGEAE